MVTFLCQLFPTHSLLTLHRPIHSTSVASTEHAGLKAIHNPYSGGTLFENAGVLVLDKSHDEDIPPLRPLYEDPLYPHVESILRSGSEKKAMGLTAFRVSKLTSITDFIVIMEGRSKPQNEAISYAIEVYLVC